MGNGTENMQMSEKAANNVQQYWDELADIKDELATRDWFPGTSGNLSIKVSDDPLQFLVTASGKDKYKRTPEDFLLVDGDGKAVHPGGGKPSAETALHVEVYKRTNAGCSLHVHTVENNVISELYAAEEQVTFRHQEIIKAFNLWEEGAELTVPIVKNPADLNELAKLVGSRIGENIFGVLIRNHGITVWGRNGFEAKKHLEAFEFLFRYQLQLTIMKSISN